MPRFRLRRGAWQMVGVGHMTLAGSLLYASQPKAIGSVLLTGRGRTTVGGNIGIVTPPPLDAWVVPDPVFQAGSGQSFDLKNTLPSGVVAGGTFDVDASGDPLPSGMTLSSDGVLNVGTATTSLVDGVVFGYNEPVATGGTASILTLHPAVSGVMPYMASFWPLEGSVPNGFTLVSPDDAGMRASVVSRWPDNSAKVMVLHGSVTVDANVPKQIRLQTGSQQGTALTASRIAALVTNVTVNVDGTPYSLTSFGSPAKVWWANERAICARYNLPLRGKLFAAIDIHAWASPQNRALVEVVVENSMFDPAAPTASQPRETFTATISVNGNALSSVTTPVSGVTQLTNSAKWGAPVDGNGMMGFRAYYQSYWVGGDPQVEVTHDSAYMGSHPMFPGKFWSPNPSASSLQTRYQNDVYTPWHILRHQPWQAGAPGAVGVGYVPNWEFDYLRSGSRYARRAVVANTLASLVYHHNYRNKNTYEVMKPREVNMRFASGLTGYKGENAIVAIDPSLEMPHHGAAGLVGFLCHPSPVMIEIAQKHAYWMSVAYNTGGVFQANSQQRGKAWGMRAYSHACFLTPDDQTAMKSVLKTVIYDNIVYWERFRNEGPTFGQHLGIIYDDQPNSTFLDYFAYQPPHADSAVGIQQPLWQCTYLNIVSHTMSRSKLLLAPGESTNIQYQLLESHANWQADLPVRMVHESSHGQWRVQAYHHPVGRFQPSYSNGVASTNVGFDSPQTWGEMYDWFFNVNGPIANSGHFLGGYKDSQRDVNVLEGFRYEEAGNNYPSQFVMSLGVAVERNRPNAEQAWTRVMTNIPSSFFSGFAAIGDDGKWGFYPRNK